MSGVIIPSPSYASVSAPLLINNHVRRFVRQSRCARVSLFLVDMAPTTRDEKVTADSSARLMADSRENTGAIHSASTTKDCQP